MSGELKRGCGRCGVENYVPAGKVDDGPPIYGHCTGCVKVCILCREARSLNHMWPDKGSSGYKEWSGTGHNQDAMPVFMLASDYLDVCKTCIQWAPEPEPVPQYVTDPRNGSTSKPPAEFNAYESLVAEYEAVTGRRV